MSSPFPVPVAPIPAGPVNEAGGLALGGCDPVAYFTMGRAMPGSPEISYVHERVAYRFVSLDHRSSFIAEPDRYLPQYGGYCSLGTAEGHKAAADPTVFAVVDGKLYLNYDREVQAEWRGDVAGNRAKADARWPTVRALTEVER